MEIKYTNPQWVEKVLQDTNGFTKPAIYKDFFDEKLLSQLDIANLINSVIEKKPRDNIRVYIHGGRRHDYEYKLFKTPLKENETIQNWAENLVEHDDFFVLLSQVGSFNDSIVQKLASHFLPLFQATGIPADGLHASVILGKYKNTPFGAHQDDNRQCVFHYHLGPGTKEMYIWEVEEFQKLTGSSDSFFNPEKIKTYAQIFPIEPYNFFVLPVKLYHVGLPKAFSISLVVNFMTITPDQYIKKAFYESYKSLWINKKDNQPFSEDPENILENIFLQKEWDLSFLLRNDRTLKYYLEESIENKKLSIISNLGFNGSPQQRTDEIKNFTNKQIKIVPPFSIYYRINGENILVFTRGNSLSMTFDSSIPKIIEKLNGNKSYDLQELFSPLLQNNKTIGMQLLNFLYKNLGVNIQEA